MGAAVEPDMSTFSTFVLGSRRDANDWESGCQGLGLRRMQSVRTGLVSMSTAKNFFVHSPEWLYLAGHYAGSLYSENGETDISFSNNGVTIQAGNQTATLTKGRDFQLHRNIKVVIWGGCSLLGSPDEVQTMKTLFGDKHVMLGFGGITGWRIVQALFGGGFIPKSGSFFGRLSRNPSPEDIVQAWMGAASQGYGGNAQIDHLFRAVDHNGQAWKLAGKQIVKA
jgi:hypothetical protein